MSILDTLPQLAPAAASTRPVLSFELFPARVQDSEHSIHAALKRLESVNPDYVSVTSKPGFVGFEELLRFVDHIRDNTLLNPLVHLTCTGSSREDLEHTVAYLLSRGVRGFLALRGDYPEGHDPDSDELPFARYLVELIRRVAQERAAALAAGGVSIGVAAYPHRHPESPSVQHDVEVLLSKQRAGANYAITQVFWEIEQYVRFVERARRAGVTIPIIPGVLPTSDPLRLLRIQELTGVPVPRDFMHRLVSAPSEWERREIGANFCSELIRGCLDEGAPGLHVYTFNRHIDALASLERAGVL